MDCPVCLQICVEPMMSGCGHTVCILCQTKMNSKCPVCRKNTRFTRNYALRDVLQQSCPKQYAEREREWLTTCSPSALIDEMTKTWEDASLQKTDFDDRHTIHILQAVINDLQDKVAFGKAMIAGGSTFVIPCTENVCMKISDSSQYSAVCRCAGRTFVFITRKKNFLK